MKPITPDEVAAKKQVTLPDFVIQAFNYCIVAAWDADDKAAVFSQKQVVKEILDYGFDHVHDRQEIFDKGWLNVETVYQQNGWNVEYDKPGYNETYEPTFKFTVKF